MSTFLANVVSHTPVWVWFLLAALLALGLRQARTHVVGRPRVLLQPALIGLLSLTGAASAFGLHGWVQGAWLLGAALGWALARALNLPRQVRRLDDGRFEIGGSWAPLAVILSVFVLRYAVGASLAIVPALAEVTAFAATASALYGLSAGLLAARAARILAVPRHGAVLQAA